MTFKEITIFTNAFHRLIESSLEDLEQNSLWDDCIQWDILNLYRKVLISYFKVNLEDLNHYYNIIRKLAKSASEYQTLEIITRIRLDIRQGNLSTSYLETISELKFSSPWKGEVHFVLAYAYSEMEKFNEAKNYFLLSYKELMSSGSKIKSIRALHNIIAMDGNINVNDRLIDDFHWIYHEAIKVNAKGVAGLALINIAREYQILKLYKKSLRNVIRGRALLRYEKGTVQYYLSLLYHAHILLDLNQVESANQLIDGARNSGYFEINGCIKVLESLRDSVPIYKIKFKKNERLLLGWSLRLKDEKNDIHVGLLEENLISYLSLRPRTRLEISRYLYGEKLDEQIINDRLKTLLGRVRKKWPQLITPLQDGTLFISGQGQHFMPQLGFKS